MEDAVNLDELVFRPWTAQGPRDVLTLVGLGLVATSETPAADATWISS